MSKLSIVIPCYNEAENLSLLLERFEMAIGDRDIELVLVNNGSTDSSADVLRDLLPNYSFARQVLVEVNQGYGYGIRQGLEVAEGIYVGWTHADLQTDPVDVIKAYDLLESHGWPDDYFVKGNRKGRPFTDVFFTGGMSLFETVLLKERLTDINAQPNIFPRSFYKSWQNPPDDFSLDLYALYLALKQGYEVQRIDVLFPERLHGESKWNTGARAKARFIKRTLDFSFNLKRAGIE